MLYILLTICFLLCSIILIKKAIEDSSDAFGLLSILPIIGAIAFLIVSVAWIFDFSVGNKNEFEKVKYQRELTIQEIQVTTSDNLEDIIQMKQKIRNWNEFVKEKQIEYNNASWFGRYFYNSMIEDWNELEMIDLTLLPVNTPSKKLIIEK